MAVFVDGWIWEPIDMQILQCAAENVKFPSSRCYRWQAEILEENGFIQIEEVDGGRMTAVLTPKGEKAAENLFQKRLTSGAEGSTTLFVNAK